MLKTIATIAILITISSYGSPKVDIAKSDHFDGEVFHNLNEAEL